MVTTPNPAGAVAPFLETHEPGCLAGIPEFVWNFEHAPGTQVHFGTGVVREIGPLCRATGVTRVLVVTDPGIELAGHLGKVLDSLRGSGVHADVFDHVIENPTTDTVDACVAAARAAGVDGLIGLGGGSSMDTAKGCNFILTNGGRMQDYWGVGKATQPMLPLLVIPTTAGTGSECQSFALISDAVSHAKMACGDRKAAARHALLDPDLTVTQPARVTAVTGIDAIAHAVESAVCRKAGDVSRAYSLAAFRLLSAGFPRVMHDPSSVPARSLMQVGAALAGVGIENAMLGAAHSCANPLTAHFGIVHGVAVGIMLPHVVRLNAADPVAAEVYGRLSPGQDLAAQLTEWLRAAGLPVRLRDAGVPDAASLAPLAPEAAAQWTAQFNPVAVTADECAALYKAAW
jgi:alcohol dehydrogenase